MQQRTSFSSPISFLSLPATGFFRKKTYKGWKLPQMWLPRCVRLHIFLWDCINMRVCTNLQCLHMRDHYSDCFSLWSSSCDYLHHTTPSRHLLEVLLLLSNFCAVEEEQEAPSYAFSTCDSSQQSAPALISALLLLTAQHTWMNPVWNWCADSVSSIISSP